MEGTLVWRDDECKAVERLKEGAESVFAALRGAQILSELQNELSSKSYELQRRTVNLSGTLEAALALLKIQPSPVDGAVVRATSVDTSQLALEMVGTSEAGAAARAQEVNETVQKQTVVRTCTELEADASPISPADSLSNRARMSAQSSLLVQVDGQEEFHAEGKHDESGIWMHGPVTPSSTTAVTRKVLEGSDESPCQDVSGLPLVRPMLDALPKKQLSFLESHIGNLMKLEEPVRHGPLHKCVDGTVFKAFTLLIITLNATVTSIAVDYDMKYNMQLKWAANLEFFFIGFYCFELGLKLANNRLYFFINQDAAWNNFDFVLVLLGIYDTAMQLAGLNAGGNNLMVGRLGRVLKLSKLLRLFRAVQFFGPLRQMLTSITVSCTMLFWALVLLGTLWFAMALVMLQALSLVLHDPSVDENHKQLIEDMFGSIPKAMFTMFSVSNFGDSWRVVYSLALLAGEFYAFLMLFYISFFTISLYNILTGIVVEHVVMHAQLDEGERVAQYRQKLVQQGIALKKLFARIDHDGSGHITRAEFVQSMEDPEVLTMMEENQVSPTDARMFFAVLQSYSATGVVEIDEFIDGCTQMRGPAAGIDVQILRCQANQVAKQIRTQSSELAAVAKLLRAQAGKEREHEWPLHLRRSCAV